MASVLLVEDEVLIRMMVTDMLEELGHRIAAEAGNLAEALALASSAVIDLAIIDVNLGSDNSEPVARALESRAIPFAFASGYAQGGMPEGFQSRPLLKKPFQMEQLARCIDELLAKA